MPYLPPFLHQSIVIYFRSTPHLLDILQQDHFQESLKGNTNFRFLLPFIKSGWKEYVMKQSGQKNPTLTTYSTTPLLNYTKWKKRGEMKENEKWINQNLRLVTVSTTIHQHTYRTSSFSSNSP